MTTVRLDQEMEQILEKYSVIQGKSKSELIKLALTDYFKKYNISDNPYETGKDLFGKYGSGESDTSSTYKKKIKENVAYELRVFHLKCTKDLMPSH